MHAWFALPILMAACSVSAQQVIPIQFVGKATLNTDEGKFAGCGIRFFGVVPDGSRSQVVDGSVSIYRKGYAMVKAGLLIADISKPSADPRLTNFPIEWVRAAGAKTLPPNKVGVMKSQNPGFFMYGTDFLVGAETFWAVFNGASLTVSFRGKDDARHVFAGKVAWDGADQEQASQCMDSLTADMREEAAQAASAP